MDITPLSTTLYGFSAVHYACATGAEVRRAHNQMPGHLIRTDEARSLLQRDQSESRLIRCIATHGDRPYRGNGAINIDWPALHAAALTVDAERRSGDLLLGYDQITDAFGGSYFPSSYEDNALAGVVRVLDGARRIRDDAWNIIHRAHTLKQGRHDAGVALRTALALDHLFRGLDAIGIYRYDPASQICGVTGYTPDDTVQVTGLRWLAGERCDDRPPTMKEVEEFIAQEETGREVMK